MKKTFRFAILFSVMLLAVAAYNTAEANSAMLELGKRVFLEVAEPKCGLCHSFADAGAVGEIGPSLDDLKPDADRVKAAVVNGIGIMPAFETLTEAEIDALAFYVSDAAGKAK